MACNLMWDCGEGAGSKVASVVEDRRLCDYPFFFPQTWTETEASRRSEKSRIAEDEQALP